jgi:PAS domain S-box-containing protein
VIINKTSKVREASQKFNKFFYSNPISLAITSIDEKFFIDVNQTFLDKLEYVKSEVIGKTSADLEIFVEPEKQILVHDELVKNGSIHNIELKVKTKSGKIIDGLFSGEIIENEGKKYFLTAMVDHTERKKYETEILKKSEELEKINKYMVARELKMIELKKELGKKDK